jgi:hypothetical protein
VATFSNKVQVYGLTSGQDAGADGRRKTPATTSCRVAACTGGVAMTAASCDGGLATAAASCDGAGSCPAAVTTSCTPFICGAGACKTACAADSDCIAADFCSGTTCAPRRANGAACAADGQCSSASCSTEGVCCSSTCELSRQGCYTYVDTAARR